MDFELYMPCQPAWFCTSFSWLFAGLLLIGLVAFIRILYLEYRKLHRAKQVRRRRQTHYSKRR